MKKLLVLFVLSSLISLSAVADDEVVLADTQEECMDTAILDAFDDYGTKIDDYDAQLDVNCNFLPKEKRNEAQNQYCENAKAPLDKYYDDLRKVAVVPNSFPPEIIWTCEVMQKANLLSKQFLDRWNVPQILKMFPKAEEDAKGQL